MNLIISNVLLFERDLQRVHAKKTLILVEE